MYASGPSLKSATSVAPPHPENGVKKKFPCNWAGCGKSFSRSEHLQRHSLNHKEGNNTCQRCAAHFRRRDLLDRHMLRHKEKDDEAGGEGLGHLATRKKLWRDSNGNIVNARRPYRQDGAKRRQISPKRVSSDDGNYDITGSLQSRDTVPPSPPTSILSTGHTTGEQVGVNRTVHDSWEVRRNALPLGWTNDTSDFLCNASWGTQPFQNDMTSPSDLPYDDLFKPDTAMSFNAPFTTMNYYNWLFEIDGMNGRDSELFQSPQSTAVPGIEGSSSGINRGGYQSSVNDRMPAFHGVGLDSNLLPSSQTSHDSLSVTFMLPHPRNGAQLSCLSEQSHQSSQSSIQDQDTAAFALQGPQYKQLRAGMTETLPSDAKQDYSHSVTSSAEQGDQTSVESEKPAPRSYSASSRDLSYSSKSSISQISTSPDQISTSLASYPLPDAHTTRVGLSLPFITPQAREGITEIINQSQPSKPDGSQIRPSDPLLSLSSLQHYSDLFFTRFNSTYPLIHQATFESQEVHNFLLMSIILLGATYSDKEAHLLAVCIHDIMRPLIHASKEFGTRPKLWMLQTILLIECFGKSRAGEKQHDMSHLYHGLLINLIRRSDCQGAYVPPFDERIHRLENHWRVSVEAEQKRRLAMLCFMWDTQHAVLFSQSLCMNASELKLTLPWDKAVWEACTASEWLQLSQSAAPPPQYLSILKMYTNPSAVSPPQSLNALSRVLIFHGLMSISWDLNRRDQTSLSLAVTNSSVPWQTRMSSCYAHWKSDFEKYTASVLSSLPFTPVYRDKFLRFSIAHMAVYHTAQLILDVDIIDLQIHAGARHIIGRPVSDVDRERSMNKIREWIRRDEGKRAGDATWHAARLFRDGVRRLENWNVDEMFHYPWCLYLASLMCWTFHDAATKGPPSSLSSSVVMVDKPPSIRSSSPSKNGGRILTSGSVDDRYDEDGDWDSYVEMNGLISALTRLDPGKESFVRDVWEVGRKHHTQGLLKCMVKQLNTVRWAVVREGMIVLRGLTT